MRRGKNKRKIYKNTQKAFTKQLEYGIIFPKRMTKKRKQHIIWKRRTSAVNKKVTVTIARQYGSGGREIGVKVAEKLGVAFYDSQLIEMATEASGISLEGARRADEMASRSLLYSIAVSPGYNPMLHSPINDKLFIAQSDIIRNIHRKESSVIIGRCSDYILAEEENVLKVFVFADINDRINRISERQNISEQKAAELIAKTDKKRSNYYNFYTGKKWGKLENYDLVINSASLGVVGASDMIAAAAKLLSEKA